MTSQSLTIRWGESGLVGSLTYGIILNTGVTLIPEGTTVGITEIESGVYQVLVNADQAGTITWAYLGESYSQDFQSLIDAGAIGTYQTIEQISAYALTKLYTDAWDSATPENKLKASYEATRRIDALQYIYSKADPDQDFEFPRTGQDAIPKEILYAHSEIALELLNSDGVTQRGVLSEGFASVRVTYDSRNIPDWIKANIPSETAWNYLLQYLNPADSVKLRRVS